MKASTYSYQRIRTFEGHFKLTTLFCNNSLIVRYRKGKWIKGISRGTSFSDSIFSKPQKNYILKIDLKIKMELYFKEDSLQNVSEKFVSIFDLVILNKHFFKLILYL